MENNLPKRFWSKEELRAAGIEPPYKFNLKTAQFRKYYNKQVNPLLKSWGFKCKGYNATKLLEDKNLLLMVNFAGGKYGGSGYLSVGVQPIFLPTKNHYEFPLEKPEMYKFICVKGLQLPNGSQDIDLGRNEDDAIETCQYLKQMLEEQGLAYIALFDSFPEPFISTSIEDFQENFKTYAQQYGIRTNFGRFYCDYCFFYARINAFYGHSKLAKAYCNYAKRLNIELGDDYMPGPFPPIDEMADSIVNQLT